MNRLLWIGLYSLSFNHFGLNGLNDPTLENELHSGEAIDWLIEQIRNDPILENELHFGEENGLKTEVGFQNAYFV